MRRAALLAVGILAGCTQPPSQCTPTAAGYVETASQQDVVDAAIVKANRILQPERRFALFRGVGTADAARQAADAPERIPVWIVAERNLGPASVAFANAECRAVILQAPALAARIGVWNGKAGRGLALEAPDITAWLLLHEIGHLAKDEGRAFESMPLVRGINFVETPDKATESAADAYAAERIRQGGKSQETDVMLAAMRVSMSLANLSWNLLGDRLIDNFGGSTLELPEVFGDPGYTHPNLELRVLVTNAWITGTAQAESLVTQFLEQRRRAARRSPRLYPP